jgi:hypothetical protein
MHRTAIKQSTGLMLLNAMFSPNPVFQETAREFWQDE